MWSQWRGDRGAYGVFSPWQDGSDNKKDRRILKRKILTFGKTNI